MSMLRITMAILLAVGACGRAAAQVADHSSAGSPAHSAAAAGQAPQAATAVTARVEAYLRNLYALGPKFTVKVEPPQPTAIPGLRSVEVEIQFQGQSNKVTMYVSDDGRYLLQGDLADMQADPFAKLRQEMDLSAAPTRGPANAKAVVVEYGDLQCPTCRHLSEVIRGLVVDYPQVRFVFREFPLTQIHPWALSAAIAGRCIYHKNPAAWWPYSEYIFDHQEKISASNIWETVIAQGVVAGYTEEAMKACMADPAMKAEVEKSTAEGVKLKVANTPTVFVNGRRLVSGERDPLVQYIDYELAHQAGQPRAAKTSAPQ